MIPNQPIFQAHPLFTTKDLGLPPGSPIHDTIAAFADQCEAVISRRMVLPTGTLLFLTIPEDPHSGALHFFDQQTGLFSLLEFDGERDGQLDSEDFDRLATRYRSSQQTFHAHPLLTVNDLGLEPGVATDKAIFAFLERSEAVASQWVQFPSGVLLFVTVPNDLESGAMYLFHRRQGVFYLLDFEGEADGQLMAQDYERLVRQHQLFELIQRPWRLRCHIVCRKRPRAGSFASFAGIG
jgi:hypothetical protein